jgi:8-oxo-dGTP pyrophosphatase MutT (NUDIX family)
MQRRTPTALIEHSFGVIPVYRKGDKTYFLIIQHNAGHWAFPKGRAEKGETELETARRELREETGITDVSISADRTFEERYTRTKWGSPGQQVDKTVRYFLGMVHDPKIKLQQAEVQDSKWATYEEARGLITFDASRKVLDEAAKALKLH